MYTYMMRTMFFFLGFVGAVTFMLPVSYAAQERTAPSWHGTEWINLDPGRKTLDVDDLLGRVVYLSFFQKW